MEVLHTLYSRDDLYDTEFTELVAPMYQSQSVQLLKMLFEWSVVDAEDIDDDKYQFAKKFSEVRALSKCRPRSSRGLVLAHLTC